MRPLWTHNSWVHSHHTWLKYLPSHICPFFESNNYNIVPTWWSSQSVSHNRKTRLMHWHLIGNLFNYEMVVIWKSHNIQAVYRDWICHRPILLLISLVCLLHLHISTCKLYSCLMCYLAYVSCFVLPCPCLYFSQFDCFSQPC